VALQGTLETFSLPDVLQLLSSTKKSGCLRVTGERADGSVWLAEGSIIAAKVGDDASGSPVDVVFELLRLETGEFVFDDGGLPDEAGKPVDVSTALEEAGKLVEEWAAIETVVPSADHWVSLAPALPGDEVTISADRWKALVAVAGGDSVRGLGSTLELAELPVARLVKELVEAELVQIGEPREAAPPPTAAPVEVVPEPDTEPTTAEPEVAAVEEPAPEPERFDPDALVIDRDAPLAPPPSPAFSVVADEPVEEAPAVEEAAPPVDEGPITPEPGEAAEIARQLANLSPKAARAVAAAAKATTPEEREAALAEVEASDEQINRDLLLKFLGSVN
jgi:hypothetical protein